MAQGKIYIGGDIGARGMTMTKHNPRYTPPELWVLGSVGDSFADLWQVESPSSRPETERENILSYRPCVGMVGGKIFFRGTHRGYSEQDARLASLDDDEWQWLQTGINDFLGALDRSDLYKELTADRSCLAGPYRPQTP